MNRSELLFLYDFENTNPNGDPGDENKPRYDEDTGFCLVTDVRLKRTIRDYLHDFKNEEIFVREIIDDKAGMQDAKTRALDFGKKKEDIFKNIREKCIDVRLFGGTIPLKNDSIKITGPVQFKMGKTLHKVNVMHIKGTGAFASKAGKGQKTFREEFVLSYGLVGFYGIINENSAKYSDMTEKDKSILLDAIWNGTKNLITRSKVGQVPRLLVDIEYKEKLYHIGDLDHLIKTAIDKNILQNEIRDITEIPLDMSDLKNKLINNKDKIESINYAVDDRLILLDEGVEKKFKDIFSSAGKLNELKF